MVETKISYNTKTNERKNRKVADTYLVIEKMYTCQIRSVGLYEEDQWKMPS